MFCVLQYEDIAPLLSQRSHSRSSRRSHSSSFSRGLRESKYQIMSDEDFEAEDKKCVYMRSRRATDDEATSGDCCDTDYFGGGNHKQSTRAQPPLEIVYEDSD